MATERLSKSLRGLASLGSTPEDSDELRLRRAVLILFATLSTTLATVWVATYAVLGFWLSAAIPFAYQVASAGSIYLLARTRRYIFFRQSQLWMSLLLPFALQWSLGGFATGSAVSAWGFVAPLGAVLFVGARQAVPWFVGFAALIVASVAVDPALQAGAPRVPDAVVLVFFALNILGPSSVSYALLQYFVRERDRVLAAFESKHEALKTERSKSERLLLNVLPEPVAERLKKSHGVIADAFPEVTVLFADIVGFTRLAERLPPADVVKLLDRVFAHWDELTAQYGLEKIKTIGDAYMVAGGVPLPRDDHLRAVAEMALAMRSTVKRSAGETGPPLEVRIGIDTGPVVAGIIGRAKFSYDLWGDTVNTAARMESHGLPGEIQVTARAREQLCDQYEFRPRGTVEVKGKGPMATFLLLGRRRERRPGPIESVPVHSEG